MRLRVEDSGLEDYLTTIYRLIEVYGYAKTTLISKELGVTPATASKVIKCLESKGLIRRVKYKGVSLTDKGLEVVKYVVRRHRIAEVFFRAFLDIDLLHSHVYAHLFEHLPDEIIERIYIKLGSPVTCPHGNKIAIPANNAGLDGIRLSDVDVGSEIVIIRIAGELIHALRVISELGLDLGSRIRVIGKYPHKIVIEVPSKGVYELPLDAAKAIIVK